MINGCNEAVIHKTCSPFLSLDSTILSTVSKGELFSYREKKIEDESEEAQRRWQQFFT